MRAITRRDALLGVPALACALAARSGGRGSSGGGIDARTLLFADLQAHFAGKLIARDNPAYDKLRRTDNLAFDRHPLLVARCANPNDAVRALDFARKRRIPLAVRAGGHCQAGRSSCDDGIVVDLSQMDSVSVDPGTGTITCGAGARVWQVNEAAAKYGLALPLGTCGDVGVSGLTLGGGVGYLLGLAGAACDSLISADIVLANGHIRTVTDESDSDLMWALRGAGANFGIVTRFTYQAIRQDKVLAGTLTFPAASAHDVLALNNSLSATLPDELSVITTVALPSAGDAQVSISVCWSGDVAQGRSVIARRITNVVAPTSQSLKETTLAEFVGRDNQGGALTCVRYGIASRQLPDEVLDELLDRREPPPALRVIFFDPVHGAITRVRPDATAFPHASGAGIGFLLAWHDPRRTGEVRAWADVAWARLAPHMSGAYVNMLDDEGDARVRAAYGINYGRLRRLKSRYDPDNLFRSNQNIRPV